MEAELQEIKYTATYLWIKMLFKQQLESFSSTTCGCLESGFQQKSLDSLAANIGIVVVTAIIILLSTETCIYQKKNWRSGTVPILPNVPNYPLIVNNLNWSFRKVTIPLSIPAKTFFRKIKKSCYQLNTYRLHNDLSRKAALKLIFDFAKSSNIVYPKPWNNRETATKG